MWRDRYEERGSWLRRVVFFFFSIAEVFINVSSARDKAEGVVSLLGRS